MARKKFSVAKLLIHAVFVLFAALCVLPLVSILSISLSNELDLTRGYAMWPKQFDFTGYQYVLNKPTQIMNAYGVSLAVSGAGVLISLLITAGISYALSRHDYKLRNALSFFVFFTMLFNGGLIPWYMLITNVLQLKNTLWALILPYLVVPWFVLVLRTFMQKIPGEIIESCMIDGASEFRIFGQMILPLSKPGLATVGLFILLRYWNDWWLGLLYIERNDMVPLQFMLYRMMRNVEFLTSANALPPNLKNTQLPRESARMAMAILAAGPMLLVYPFFQQFFVKGLTVGAVKG